jgi:predicted esterase
MTEAPTGELIDRYLAGEAGAEELAQLQAQLVADPTMMRRLYQAAERECELCDLFAPVTAVHLQPAYARGDGEARPTARLARRRARLRLYWLPWAAAAVLLAAVLVPQLHRLQHGGRSEEPQRHEPGSAVTPRLPPPSRPAPDGPAGAVARNDSAARLEAPVPDDPDGPTRVQSAAETQQVQQPGDDSAGAPALASLIPAKAGPARRIATASAQIDSRDGEVFDENGSAVMRYTLRAPHAPGADARLGLVLCFHGAGGDERWLADPMLEALRAASASGEFVVASLKSQGKNWMSDDEPRVQAFIDWARRSYPIDARRIILQGVSNGGWFVNFFSSRHLDQVAGVVTLCNGGGFDLHRIPDPGNTAPEFYVVHGTDDRDVNVRSSRTAVAGLRSLGFRFVYREYPGVAHNVYDDERTRRDFAAWAERLRHKTMPLTEEDHRALTAFARPEDADRLVQTAAGGALLLRIGGVQAELVLVRCLRARLPAVRAAAAGLLARTACSPGVSALIIPLLEDKDEGVRRAALTTLATVSDWNDQEALVALCLFAGTRTHARDERALAVDRLDHALAFRSSPGLDNQLIYELLIHLLEDEDQDLRTTALEALAASPAKPATRFGYRPEAAPAARHEAVARWKAWYLELFAPPDKNEAVPRK